MQVDVESMIDEYRGYAMSWVILSGGNVQNRDPIVLSVRSLNAEHKLAYVFRQDTTHKTKELWNICPNF